MRSDPFEVGSQVGLAALLDTECLEMAMLDPELVADAALWGTGGVADVLAAHPAVDLLVQAAVVSGRTQVRATIAGRPDLDATLYPVLASDRERSVRARVAANHSSPGAVLERLAHDPEPVVCEAALLELRRRNQPTAHAS